MNAVVISVLIMLILSLLRMNVVFSLLIASLVGGLIGNLSLSKTVEVFSEGLGNSAEVALSYALLGGFAIAISKTGLPNAIVRMIIKMVGKQGESKRKQYSKALVLLVILFMSCFHKT